MSVSVRVNKAAHKKIETHTPLFTERKIRLYGCGENIFRPFIEKLGQYYWEQQNVVGQFLAVHHPEKTFSVLEPSVEGGCEQHLRSTVKDTAVNYKQTCLAATNAGFFDVDNGTCLGKKEK